MNESKVGRHVTLEGQKWLSMHMTPRMLLGKGTFEGGLIRND